MAQELPMARQVCGEKRGGRGSESGLGWWMDGSDGFASLTSGQRANSKKIANYGHRRQMGGADGKARWETVAGSGSIM